MSRFHTLTPPVHARHCAVRGVIRAMVGLALGAIMVNTWLLGGLVVPAIVRGGSMAPTLLGTHLQWTCDGCNLKFACDVASLPSANCPAICPHCGHGNDVDRGVVKPGQRVLINRSAFGLRKPRRWETVVLRSPDEPEMLCIKRIVGLPGEVVEIRDGDVVIDGRVAKKQPRMQAELAVAVADEKIAQRRWRPEQSGAWIWRDGWCEHVNGKPGVIDWLVYHHVEPTAESNGSEPPILDGSPYDQAESRRLNSVPDVLLRFEVQGSADGICYLRACVCGDDFRIALPLGGGVASLSRNGTRVHAARLPGGHQDLPPVALLVSDHRLELSLASRLVMRYDFEPTAAEDARTHLACGTSDRAVRVGKFALHRDVYYTRAPGGPSQYRLGPDEYFVLGDNSPHSVDSRTWASRGGVSAAMLLGPALAW